MRKFYIDANNYAVAVVEPEYASILAAVSSVNDPYDLGCLLTAYISSENTDKDVEFYKDYFYIIFSGNLVKIRTDFQSEDFYELFERDIFRTIMLEWGNLILQRRGYWTSGYPSDGHS
jgi:hypothetical protein